MGLAPLLLHGSAIATSSAQEQPGSELDNKVSLSGLRYWHLYYPVIKWTGPES